MIMPSKVAGAGALLAQTYVGMGTMKYRLSQFMRAGVVWAAPAYFIMTCASRATADTVVASDNGSDSAYTSGWNSGTNGGIGFGPWTFQGGGQFVGSSSIGQAWGLETNSLASAGRSFAAGPLTVGETFALEMSAGSIPVNGGLAAFDLADASNSITILGFGYQQGANGDYYVSDGSGSRRDTGVVYTGAAVNVSFTLTSNTTYSAAITPVAGTTTTLSGVLANTSGDHTIESLDFVAFDNGTQAQNAAYFNNLSITSPAPLPKAAPAGAVLLVASGVVALIRRRVQPEEQARRDSI